jgi:hypothetical protein
VKRGRRAMRRSFLHAPHQRKNRDSAPRNPVTQLALARFFRARAGKKDPGCTASLSASVLGFGVGPRRRSSESPSPSVLGFGLGPRNRPSASESASAFSLATRRLQAGLTAHPA